MGYNEGEIFMNLSAEFSIYFDYLCLTIYRTKYISQELKAGLEMGSIPHLLALGNTQ